jgi:precorrin-6A synthase
MRKILVIGIGAGHPEHITIQAINALRTVDVLFITDKGADKEDLARFRREICATYVPERTFRTVVIPDPDRDRAPHDYQAAVASWHDQRAALYETLFAQELGDHDCGAFLVWGDPSLYDSTIRILRQITERGAVQFDYEVIPGITAVQALTARHRIPLNRVGEPVQITTGRQLAAQAGQASHLTHDSVVLLDGECAFSKLSDDGLEIYWGAYLGTADEILLSGPLAEIAPRIQETRAAARARKGWIMDTYLLRKPAPSR